LVNPVLLASGLGMIAVGIVPVLYWAKTRGVKSTPVVFGSMLWVAAIALKAALDLTLGGAINAWANAAFGTARAFIFLSLYVGARTGAFESGFSYVAFLKTRLRIATYDDAIGFGLAYGGTEAILLGIISFLNVLLYLLNPGLIDQIPLSQREATVAALNAPSVVVFAPIIERAFTMLVHLFATVLVYAAVLTKSSRMFWLSFIYRGAIDAMVPWLGRLLAQSPNPVVMTYTVELLIAIYGLLGLLGVRWLRGKLGAPR
jgi:uncharacterized membrane protein YhfC